MKFLLTMLAIAGLATISACSDAADEQKTASETKTTPANKATETPDRLKLKPGDFQNRGEAMAALHGLHVGELTKLREEVEAMVETKDIDRARVKRIKEIRQELVREMLSETLGIAGKFPDVPAEGSEEAEIQNNALEADLEARLLLGRAIKAAGG